MRMIKPSKKPPVVYLDTTHPNSDSTTLPFVVGLFVGSIIASVTMGVLFGMAVCQ